MLALEWNLDDAKQAWFEDGMEQGIKQGKEQGLEAVAVKLIRRGRSFDEIHEDTGLSLERIEELAEHNSLS